MARKPPNDPLSPQVDLSQSNDPPRSSLFSSLLGPNPDLVSQLGASPWFQQFQGVNTQGGGNLQGYFPESSWRNQGLLEEQQDQYEEDYDDQDRSTPQSIPGLESGQNCSSPQTSGRSTAFQAVCQDEQIGGQPKELNEVPVKEPLPFSAPSPSVTNTTPKSEKISVSINDRAAELKRKLLAQKQQRSSMTPSIRKTESTSKVSNPPGPAKVSSREEESQKSGAEPTSLPSTMKCNPKTPVLAQSATANSNAFKSPASGHTNGTVKGGNQTTNGAETPKHADGPDTKDNSEQFARFILSRQDSSKAIDNLLAEEKAAADAITTAFSTSSAPKANGKPHSSISKAPEQLSIPSSANPHTNPAKGLQKTSTLPSQEARPVGEAGLDEGEILEVELSKDSIINIPTKPKDKSPPKKGSTQGNRAVHLQQKPTNTRRPIQSLRREDDSRSDYIRGYEATQRGWPSARALSPRRYSDDRIGMFRGDSQYRDSYPRDRPWDDSRHRRPSPGPQFRRESLAQGMRSQVAVVKPTIENSSRRFVSAEAILPFPLLSTSPNQLSHEMEEWLQITGFHDQAYRQNKLGRHRILLVLEEQKRKILLEDREEEEARARAAGTPSLPAGDRGDPAIVLSETLRASSVVVIPPPDVQVPAHRAQTAPDIDVDDDVGMRIRDSARQSRDASPMQNSFPDSNLPSLKRHLSTNDQDKEMIPAEKLPRLNQIGRGNEPTSDESYIRLSRPQADMENTITSRGRATSVDRQRFRSRSRELHNDGRDYLPYDDERNTLFRSRDSSPSHPGHFGSYDAYRPSRPATPNVDGGNRPDTFDNRGRGGAEYSNKYVRRDAQSHDPGRAAYRGEIGPRGGFRGYGRSGYGLRGGRHYSGELRDEERYRR